MDAKVQLRNVRKRRSGVVVKNSGDKTVAVQVEQRRRHPLYGKVVRHVHRVLAHDEANEAKVGDKVTLVESRPYSCRKHWRIVKISEKK